MKLDFEPSEVVFLLGAGSSIAANVPDTYRFVEDFLKYLENSDKDKFASVKKIIDILQNRQNKNANIAIKVDIELLLETLVKLEDRKQEQLLDFFETPKYLLDEPPYISSIINDLKNFIKTKSIVDIENVGYLAPITEFVEESDTPLDIISVNYDTCIEQLCNIYKLICQDGFNVFWEPQVFELADSHIRLYKLHGSVMWYMTDRNTYMKVPILTEESEIELITKEHATSLMIYPMRKWEYAEPLLELLIIVKKFLESERCKFLIVAGYSFRDEHTVKILWDAAAKNRNMIMLLIDPNAYSIYHDKLEFCGDNIVSPLKNRVICLPYKFEQVLPLIKNYYLKNLREGLNVEKVIHSHEIKGENTNWAGCLASFANCEYYDKFNYIFNNKIDKTDFGLGPELDFNIKFFVNLLANGRKDEALTYHNNLIALLKLALVERLKIDGIKSSLGITVLFNHQSRNGGGSYNSPEDISKSLNDIMNYVNSRSQMILHNEQRIFLEKFCQNIKQLSSYISNWLTPGGWPLKQYIEERKVYLTEDQLNSLKKEPDKDYNEWDTKDVQAIIRIIEQVEKKYLKTLFSSF